MDMLGIGGNQNFMNLGNMIGATNTPSAPPPAKAPLPGKGYTPYSGNGQQVDPNAPLMPMGPGGPAPVYGSTFTAPGTAGSAWTGVSSNADPYGIHNLGYDISKVPTQVDNKGNPTTSLTRNELLRAGGYQPGEMVTNGTNQSNTSFVGGPTGDLPDSLKFSGYTKYENQNAADGSALGSDASQIAAQTQNAQSNLNAAQSGYPAYGNQYGLGGQISPPSSTGAPANAAQSDYGGGQGVTMNVPDTSSRGFNPWSIQGESNSRDTNKGVSI